MIKLQKLFNKSSNKKTYFRYSLTVPQELVKELKLKGGEEFECMENENGDILFMRLKK
jgi:hypothetical protein